MALPWPIVHAQESFSPGNIEADILKMGGRIVTKNPNLVYDGTPYLNEDFIYGEILSCNHRQYSNLPLRYNIYSDEIEYKHLETNRIFAFHPDTVFICITISEDTFIVSHIDAEGISKDGFFNRLVNGNTSLLVKYNMDFKEAQAASTHKIEMPALYVRKPNEYYFTKDGSIPIKIKNVKKLIEILGDHSDELTAYSKSKKISGKHQEDLRQLIVYYNSLK